MPKNPTEYDFRGFLGKFPEYVFAFKRSGSKDQNEKVTNSLKMPSHIKAGYFKYFNNIILTFKLTVKLSCKATWHKTSVSVNEKKAGRI